MVPPADVLCHCHPEAEEAMTDAEAPSMVGFLQKRIAKLEEDLQELESKRCEVDDLRHRVRELEERLSLREAELDALEEKGRR